MGVKTTTQCHGDPTHSEVTSDTNGNFVNSKDADHSRRKIAIRPLEPRDERTAVRMVWEQTYVDTGNTLLKEQLTALPFVFVDAALALAMYLLSGSISLAIFVGILLPLLIIFYFRYILIQEYRSGPGVREGFVNYWCHHPDRRFWVAEVGGAVIGTCAVTRNSADTAQVHRVCVSTECRGRGVARALMEHLLKHCRETGVAHVILTTSSVQRPAHRLYERLGFVDVNSMDMSIGPLHVGFHLYHLGLNGTSPGRYAQPGIFKTLGR